MKSSRTCLMSTTRVLAIVLIAAALAAAPASFADERQAGHSQVTVGTFYYQEQVTDTINDAFCFEGLTGALTGTDTVSGHFNNAPDFFHAKGTDTFDSRVVYPDGRYVVGAFSTSFEISANAESGVVDAKDTEISQGLATVYGADGSVLGTVTMRGTFHITYTDLNGNGQPDPGEIKAWVDRVRSTCP
jgi:hypothetical protein